jgi:hypothetical protein
VAVPLYSGHICSINIRNRFINCNCDLEKLLREKRKFFLLNNMRHDCPWRNKLFTVAHFELSLDLLLKI